MPITKRQNEFLQGDFLTQEFLRSHGASIPGVQFNVRTLDATGFQAQAQIDASKAAGLQTQAQIDSTSATGFQYDAEVALSRSVGLQTNVQIDDSTARGVQAEVQIDSTKSIGLQFDGEVSLMRSLGVQLEGQIQGLSNASGFQFDGEVAGAGRGGIQANVQVDADTARGHQFLGKIEDLLKTAAIQFQTQIDTGEKSAGVELRVGSVRHICSLPVWTSGDWLTGPFLAAQCKAGVPLQFLVETTAGTRFIGAQTLAQINTSRTLGLQFQTQIDDDKATGVQFLATEPQGVGFQWRIALYNTNNLRILCDFASRGTVGTNWTTNSQAAGDFDVNNVNTDVVEQVYRSSSITGVQIVCDTQVSQGTFLDTLAILNHNMTTSATVVIEGSNDAGFATSESFSLSQARDNTYYIAPQLPIASYRYWRFNIDDATNSDGFIEIGAILFGSATIFSGECFANPIRVQRQNFSQGVMTEGFTSVSNDRGIKRRVSLDFRSLDFQGGNYDNIVEVFETRRTTHKCLWIPDPRYPSRYAVFGKLVEIPEEEHNDMGETADYVSFNITIDEAK